MPNQRRLGAVFGSEDLQAMGLGLSPRPENIFDPDSAPVGLSGIPTVPQLDGRASASPGARFSFRPAQLSPQMMADIDANLDSMVESGRASQPAMPAMLFDEQSGRMWVNGFEFDETNASDALRSEQYLTQPRTQNRPGPGNWRPLSTDEYAAYLDEVKNPSIGRRSSEALQSGMRSLGQSYAGALLLADPNNEWAQQQIEDINRGYERDAPFMQQWSDVETPGDFGTYALQTTIQMVPWVVESVAFALGGAAIGGALTGGPGALPGVAMGLAERQAIRAGAERVVARAIEQQAVYRQLSQQAGRALTREEAIQAASRAGMSTNFDELFTAAQAVATNRGRTAGALAATIPTNYATSSGDVFVNLLNAGADPHDPNARGLAAEYGVPYALGETASDVVTGGLALGLARGGLSGNRALRALTGFGAGSVAEGATEAGQQVAIESAVNDYTGQPMSDQDRQNILESGIAGAIGGAVFGGVAGGISPAPIRDNAPTNLLDPSQPSGPPQQPRDRNLIPMAPEMNAVGGLEKVEPWDMGGPETTPPSFAELPEIQTPEAAPVEPQLPPSEDFSPPRVRNRLLETRGGTPERRAMQDIIDNPNLTPDQRREALDILGQDPHAREPIGRQDPQPDNEFDDERAALARRATVQSQREKLKKGQGFNRRAARTEEAKNFEDQTLYPPPPQNEVEGTEVEATVRDDAPIEDARFVTEDEVIDVKWAEGGKVPMKAYTYYVYNGTPVRRDVYERTRVPVDGSRFGASGKFKMKPGLKLKAVRASKDGTLKTLETPQAGNKYRAGELIFTGVAGEQWNQSQEQAEKKYAIQERGAEAVPMGEAPQGSEEMGGQVRDTEKPAEARREEAPASEGKEEKVTDARRAEFEAWVEKNYNTKYPRTIIGAFLRSMRAGRKPIKKIPFSRTELEALDAYYLSQKQEAKSQIGKEKQEERAGEKKLKEAARREREEARAKNAILSAMDAISLAEGPQEKIAAQQTFMEAVRNDMETAKKLAADNPQIQLALKTIQSKKDGKFSTSEGDDGNVTGIGRSTERLRAVRETVRKINSFLRVKLDVTVTANLDTLRKENRALYEQAIKSYGPGREEFLRIASYARGYGFDGKVIMFADNVPPGLEAREYIHELLHFGWHVVFRLPGLVSDPRGMMEFENSIGVDFMRHDLETNASEEMQDTVDSLETFGVILEWLYFRNSEVRHRTDRMIDQGRYRSEAIEEAVTEMLASKADNLMKAQDRGVWKRFVEAVRLAIEWVAKQITPSLNTRAGADVLSSSYMNFMLAKTAAYALKEKYVSNYAEQIGLEPDGVFTRVDLTAPEGVTDSVGHFIEAFRADNDLGDINNIFIAPEAPGRFANREQGEERLRAIIREAAKLEKDGRLPKDWTEQVNNALKAKGMGYQSAQVLLNGLRHYSQRPTALSREARRLILLTNQNSLKPNVAAKAKQDLQSGKFSTAEDVGTAFGHVRPYNKPDLGAVTQSVIDAYRTASGRKGALKSSARAFGDTLENVTRFFESMDNLADRSKLAETVMGIVRAVQESAREYQSIYERGTHLVRYSKMFQGVRQLLDKQAPEGASNDAVAGGGEMLGYARVYKMQVEDKDIETVKIPVLANGAVDEETALKTIFQPVSLEEFRDGIQLAIKHKDKTLTKTTTYKYEGKAPIEEAYKVYLQMATELARSKLHRYQASLDAKRKNDAILIQRLFSGTTPTNEGFVRDYVQEVDRIYQDISMKGYVDGNAESRQRQQKRADAFLKAAMDALHDPDMRAKWLDPNLKITDADEKARSPEWAIKEYEGLVGEIRRMLQSMPADTQVTDKISRGMSVTLKSLLDNRKEHGELAERAAVEAIMRGYTPLSRQGNVRVFVEAHKVDEAGNVTDEVFPLPEKIKDVAAMLRVENMLQGRRAAADLEELLGGETFELEDREGGKHKVQFVAKYEHFTGAKTLANMPSLQMVEELMELIGRKIDAQARERLANLLNPETGRFLELTANPGWDADVIKFATQHLDSMGWLNAYVTHNARERINESLNDKKLVSGDLELLKKLQKEHDDARNAPPGARAALIHITGRNLRRYANQFAWAQPRQGNLEVSIKVYDPKTLKEETITYEKKGRGRYAVDEMRKMLEMVKQESNLVVNDQDWLSKHEYIRASAGVFMLGGQIATAFMNATSVLISLPPYLASMNKKTGYGMGFGMGATTEAIWRATSTVYTNLDLLDRNQLSRAIDEGRSIGGLDLPTMRFLLNEMDAGELRPKQLEQITGGAENRIGNALIQEGAQAAMSLFATVESANRMISALAARQLITEQMVAAGVSREAIENVGSPEYMEMRAKANEVIVKSQGDYSRGNKAAWTRGSLGELLYTFRHFPVIMTQLIYHLPTKAQVAMLAMLWLMGGLKGEPFAEDIMDLYDTLLQLLGFKHDSVELQIARFANDMVPGSAPFVLRGGLDSLFLGGTFSSRVSLGNILPFTGSLRAGADFGRELQDAFGPAYSNLYATTEWSWHVASYVAGVLGLADQTTTFQQVLSNSSIAGMRSVGDVIQMAQTGQIADRQGRLVSDNVNIGTIMMRAAGFYPIESTRANDAIRLSRYHDGFMKVIRARYTLAYATAHRQGDTNRMNQIERDVAEWNLAVERAGRDDMQITNFRRAAMRASRAADQTSIERYQRSASDASDQLVEEIAAILNADTERSEDRP